MKKKILYAVNDVAPITIRTFGAAWACFSGFLVCTCWRKLAKSVSLANLNPKNAGHLIEKMKRDFLQTTDLTEEYQRCFGIVILLVLLHSSVWFINSTFYLFTSIQRARAASVSNIANIVEIVKEACIFFTLAYIPTYMQHQVMQS